MTNLSLHLQSIHAMKAAFNGFFWSPHPLKKRRKNPHKHTCTTQSFNIKITRLSKSLCPPTCTVSLHCFRWRALTKACDYDFWQGMINWMFKNPACIAHLNGVFDQDCGSPLVRWPAQGCMGCRWSRVGWGVQMWWRGTLLSTVWNNELMELGLHDAGPFVRPTGGILA